MRITRKHLRRIIQEELGGNGRSKAADKRAIFNTATIFAEELNANTIDGMTPAEKASVLELAKWLVDKLPALIGELEQG